ncbi:MAG: hypothetical protein KDD58_10000 [Bdellovibrionales bacterium]|nr:hypothetical protein [Bdellovibrionales bacterium]
MQVSAKEQFQIQKVREESLKDSASQTYYEESHKDYHQIDALNQLKANVSKITDLQYRLNYMMSEIQSLVKKR